MPIRKTRLNTQAEGRYLRCLRQLQGEGVEVEIPPQSAPLDIIVSRGLDAMVFNTPLGGVGYAITVRLVAEKPVTLTECRITAPWSDQIELESPISRGPVYKIGNQEYPMEKILNLRFETGLRFPRAGHWVEGVILATGFDEIPDNYRHGMLAPCQLCFLDQHENRIEHDAQLLVHRTPRVVPRRIPGQMLLRFNNLIPRDGGPAQFSLPFDGATRQDVPDQPSSLDRSRPSAPPSRVPFFLQVEAPVPDNLASPRELRR